MPTSDVHLQTTQYYKINDNFSASICMIQTIFKTERYFVSDFLTSPILMKLENSLMYTASLFSHLHSVVVIRSNVPRYELQNYMALTKMSVPIIELLKYTQYLHNILR